MQKAVRRVVGGVVILSAVLLVTIGVRSLLPEDWWWASFLVAVTLPGFLVDWWLARDRRPAESSLRWWLRNDPIGRSRLGFLSGAVVVAAVWVAFQWPGWGAAFALVGFTAVLAAGDYLFFRRDLAKADDTSE